LTLLSCVDVGLYFISGDDSENPSLGWIGLPMYKPDFFMIGAGKAGTTALWSWLREHPQIYLSRINEPRYFADDMPHLMMRIASEAKYLPLLMAPGRSIWQ